jgi:hypothetical protein
MRRDEVLQEGDIGMKSLVVFSSEAGNTYRLAKALAAKISLT